MKSIQVIVQLAFGIGLLLAAILPAYSHDGGLDSYGRVTTGEGWRLLLSSRAAHWPVVRLSGRDAEKTANEKPDVDGNKKGKQ